MVEGEEAPDRWGHSIVVGVALALCAIAAIRLAGMTLLFIPRWLALIVVVVGSLEVLSVMWNVVRGEPWNERTFFDYISDALMYVPWS